MSELIKRTYSWADIKSVSIFGVKLQGASEYMIKADIERSPVPGIGRKKAHNFTIGLVGYEASLTLQYPSFVKLRERALAEGYNVNDRAGRLLVSVEPRGGSRELHEVSFAGSKTFELSAQHGSEPWAIKLDFDTLGIWIDGRSVGGDE